MEELRSPINIGPSIVCPIILNEKTILAFQLNNRESKDEDGKVNVLNFTVMDETAITLFTQFICTQMTQIYSNLRYNEFMRIDKEIVRFSKL